MNDMHYEALATIMVSHAKTITNTLYTTLPLKGKAAILRMAVFSGLSPESVAEAASETVSATEQLWKLCYRFLTDERKLLALMCDELAGRSPSVEGSIGLAEEALEKHLNEIIEKAAELHIFFEE